MNRRIFDVMFRFASKNTARKKAIIFLDKKIPQIVMLIFYGLLLYLLLSKNRKFFVVAGVPWLSFFFVTVLRNFLNRPRPFDELPITPLVHHSSGRSFPSRHASSSAIIAMAVYYIYPPLGILTWLLAACVSATRVLTGVHYPADVLSGVAISTMIGTIFFHLLLSYGIL